MAHQARHATDLGRIAPWQTAERTRHADRVEPRQGEAQRDHPRTRVLAASGRTVRFADGTETEADAIIWATGYQSDYSWIKLPVFDERGRPRHRRGVTDQTGLYFLGLQWQYTRGSALLGFVSDDARYIAQQITSRSRSTDDAAVRPWEARMTTSSSHAGLHAEAATDRTSWWVLGFIGVAQFMVILDVTVVNIALPSISNSAQLLGD